MMSAERAMKSGVTDRKGTQHHLHILPYQKTDEKVDGAVIMLAHFPRKKVTEDI